MTDDHAVAQYADKINAAWQQSVTGILDVGRLLAQAKQELATNLYTELVALNLPFSTRTAQRLIAIGQDGRLATHVSRLPNHWGTLYELTRLDDKHFAEAIDCNVIHPAMERRDLAQSSKADKRLVREQNLAAKITALPDQRFGVIYADPPWKFEPYSTETGMDRAADNHYPTQAYAEIAKLDVASIAADDCVLFLWATVPMLTEALAIMKIWGFVYKSHCVWDKQRVGTGYWFRNAHELLLLGTKGQIPAPAPGTQFPSLIEAAAGKHSAKPEQFLDLIEAYFPTLPKIELYRRGLSRKNWAAWGAESEVAA